MRSMTLRRVLSATDAGWLVAGNMIGAGIFITPGLVAGQLPGVAAPLAAWTFGGVLALCGAAVYGELGARLPQAGGDYQYLRVAFGPMWGFLTGWAALVVTFSGAAAVMAVVAVDHLATAWPAFGRAPELVRVLAAPLLLLTLVVANAAGARTAGRTTALFTAIPVTGLAILFGIGLLLGSATTSDSSSAAPSSPVTLLAWGAALVPVFFTYSGWNAAAYVAGEVRDPARNLGRALVLGTTLVTVFYVAVNLVLFSVLVRSDLSGSTTAVAAAARQLLGEGAERALAAMIAVAVLGSANVTLMAGARIYYAMARDGLAPRVLATTGTSGVPAAAVWASGIWTALMSLTRRIETLVNWATLAILLLSGLAVASLFVLRRRGVDETETHAQPYRCPGHPVTPIIYLIASIGVAVSSVFYDWRQALYGVLLVFAGVPVYFVVRRFLPAANSGRD
jgi:APA family basic amino acid/polyamine antiporter